MFAGPSLLNITAKLPNITDNAPATTHRVRRPASAFTLGDLIREGKLLWVYCRECHQEVTPQDVHSAPD